MNFRHNQDEIQEWASLYTLNVLSPPESAAFESHLNADCSVCDADVHSFDGVIRDLASASTETPPTQLRSRVLETATRTAIAIRYNRAGLLIASSNHIPWQPTGIRGIQCRTLFNDAVRKYSTYLVRMDPGTVYPSHRHSDLEEVYVLEGDLLVEGYVMRAGDYCRAEAGTVHAEVRTESGCVLFALGSQQDEILTP